MTFCKMKCLIRNGSAKVIAGGTRRGRELYAFNGSPRIIEKAHIASSTPDLHNWHKWLGHVNYAAIISMLKKGLASGMPIDLSTLPPVFQHCIIGKQTKTTVPKIWMGEWAEEKLQKVYSDITGLEEVGTKTGEKYMLIFIDEATRMAWIYPSREKSNATPLFKDWKALVEKKTGMSVKVLHTDNGGEYTSNNFEAYLQHEGVRHKVTVPYTSAQNGKSECCHWTIMNRVRVI
jgi:hypothetical protein